jgi:hypothetical protein
MLSTRKKVNNECLHIENDEHVQTIINNRARNVFSHKKQASIQMLACQKSQQFSTNSR